MWRALDTMRDAHYVSRPEVVGGDETWLVYGVHYPRRRLYSGRGYSVQSRVSVCLFVRALKGKRLELSTPNFVHVYSIVVAWRALTQRSFRSHGYENRHSRTVASDACCYGRVLLLPAWVCMSIRLPMFSIFVLMFTSLVAVWLRVMHFVTDARLLLLCLI